MKMTNAEYFEKNNVFFTEVMKQFNAMTTGTSFDEFLKTEYHEHKFNVGDLIVLQLNDETKGNGWKHNVVFEVIGFSGLRYDVKCLTPTECCDIGGTSCLTFGFIDRNCVFY